MKEVFDLKRFALVLKREVETWWKPLLVAYALVVMLMYINIKHWRSVSFFSEQIFYTSIVVSVYVLASRVLANIWTRRRCIATLTLPASAAEIFVARYLLWLLIPFLLSGAALLIHEKINLVELFTFDEFWNGWRLTIGFMVMGMHLLMLGGAFFNSKSLLKTAGISLALIAAVITILDFSNVPYSAENLKLVIWLSVIVSVIAGVAVSYQRFSRRTVNQYKK